MHVHCHSIVLVIIIIIQTSHFSKQINKKIYKMATTVNFQNGPCGCCGDPGGCGTCCITCCCPCYSFYKAAEDIGDDNGVLYCIGTLLGFGCCMLTVLGDKVAQEANITDHGIGKSALCACFECCVCYSCAVANEAALIKIKKEAAVPAVAAVAEAEKMEDRA